MEANKTGDSTFSDRSKQSTPFGFGGRQDTSKSDFDSAFASVGGPKPVNRQVTGSSQGEGSGRGRRELSPRISSFRRVAPADDEGSRIIFCASARRSRSAGSTPSAASDLANRSPNSKKAGRKRFQNHVFAQKCVCRNHCAIGTVLSSVSCHLSPAFKFAQSQSICPGQRTNEKPATAENEKASHETTAPRSRARTARKVQVNGLSRLCNHMGSITILHLCTNRSQLALEIERPVLTSQPHLGTESPCG